eukprot:1146110-Rhodomonas_salina.1
MSSLHAVTYSCLRGTVSTTSTTIFADIVVRMLTSQDAMGTREDEVFLIVTADDFGMTPERDRGIIQAKKKGILTNTSLLVNGSTAREAVEEAKQCGLSVGLHLNLTEGPPISDAASVPSLLGVGPKWWPRRGEKAEPSSEELQFLGKEGIRQALKDGKLSMSEAAVE